MEWLANNWLCIAAIVVVAVVIVIVVARQKGGGATQTGSQRPLTRAEQEQAATLVAKLSEAFESIVTNVVGEDYSREDRQKIAIGMVAVMATEGITLERISSDKALLASVMAKSMAVLTARGEVRRR